MQTRLLLSGLCAAAGLTLAAGAQAVSDPTGDFVPGYTGSHDGDLDVVSSTVTYDADTHMFNFSATLDAPVGATPGTFHVWGIDRGKGTEKFNTGPAPIGVDLWFDTVVIFRLDGTAAAGGTTLHDVTWNGNTISGDVPDSLPPTQGLSFLPYTWNLWPRDGSVTGNAAISDFAPDAFDAGVTAVPEPGSLAMLGRGGTAAGGAGTSSQPGLARRWCDAARGIHASRVYPRRRPQSHDEKCGLRVIPRVVSFE